ncbi:MAG: 4'-phosphopantetheinyl transferase superfamily protein [Oscillospiraceae bacterium]|nr:4'-phosphopantetheinyl transferase superfamily protein [Oscillospiraceae bacterium]
MLLIFDNLNNLEDDFCSDFKSLLSVQRITKINGIKSQAGKNASAAVYLLLRLGLLRMYGINKAVDFEFVNHKKPILPEFPGIFFNLSHTKNTAACAISYTDVGVDVEYVRPVSDKLAKRVLTKNEYKDFIASSNKDEYFCKIWTIKESFLKKTGDGITKELSDISAAELEEIQTYKGDDYFCSVCGLKMEILHIGREDFEELRS